MIYSFNSTKLSKLIPNEDDQFNSK